MSSQKLIGFLVKGKTNEKAVYQIDRQQLMEAWAKVIFEGRDKPKASKTELELQIQRLEFKK